MNGKMTAVFLAAGMVVGGILATDAKAAALLDGVGVEASGSMDYYSKYMWRGYTLDQDPVVQSAFTLGAGGFSAGVWTSMPVADDDGSISNEVDLTLSYGFDLGPVGVSVGHITYEFPGVGAPTREVFAGVSASTLPFALGVTYYNDYDAMEGSYISLDAGKDVPLSGLVTATIAAHYGVFDGYGNIENGGDYSLALKLGVPLTEKLSLTPALVYAAPTGDLADDAIGGQEAGVYGGFSLGYSF